MTTKELLDRALAAKDVAILKDRRSVEMLIPVQCGEEVDEQEWGGCGCVA